MRAAGTVTHPTEPSQIATATGLVGLLNLENSLMARRSHICTLTPSVMLPGEMYHQNPGPLATEYRARTGIFDDANQYTLKEEVILPTVDDTYISDDERFAAYVRSPFSTPGGDPDESSFRIHGAPMLNNTRITRAFRPSMDGSRFRLEDELDDSPPAARRRYSTAGGDHVTSFHH